MHVEIIPFQSKYATIFRDLNVAWLEKYFVVEPHDKEVLSRCEETIINPGGYIYFAKVDNTIVGCFALMKMSDGVFELTKMAVSPAYQGKKIGQELLKFTIETAKKEKFKQLLLYSNRKLENAIYLYRKYGFEEVTLEKNNPYQRADIKMVYKGI
ncbi:GNAT family N-acetyltransferase [Galbibacter mesophilus]|uniref:GNAT family N-acetyltransferase n=1 Tax=Galbibacter mesophilus TaxID=379069 RepID=UPI00191D34BE|nr:GNAT family N-acetyltransferase [Galbibacter mesophilus]MCM5663571.1 GNAT family N-acetyltransferase [Galbibacter mesophilus]